MKTLSVLTITMLLLGILGTSCKNENYDFDRMTGKVYLGQQIAAPAYITDLTLLEALKRFYKDAEVGHYPDGMIYIKYTTFEKTFLARDAIKIANRTFPSTKFTDATPGWSNNAATFEVKQAFIFPNGGLMDKIELKTLNLLINMDSKFQQRGNLILQFPNLKFGGNMYTYSIPITQANGSFTFNQTVPVPTGYMLEFDSPTNNSREITIRYQYQYDGAIGSGESNVGISFNDLTYKTIYGYVGNISLGNINNQVDIKLYDTEIEGMEWVDPKVNLIVTNSYGLPVGITMSNVNAYRPAGNLQQAVLFNGTDNSILFKDIAFLSNVSEDKKVTTKVIDKSNSSMRDALNSGYEFLRFNINAATNPDGRDISKPNIVKEDSEIEIKVEVELPFHGNIMRYTVYDTIDLGMNFTDNLEYIKFYITCENSMPTDGFLTLMLVNDQLEVIDTMQSKIQYMKSPTLVNGMTTKLEKNDPVIITYAKPRIENLKLGKKLIMKGDYTTTLYNVSKPNVKFMKDNRYLQQISIDMKFGITQLDSLK